MPTDTAGRALELVLRLSGFWGGSPALGELFFLCQLAPKVLEFCRSVQHRASAEHLCFHGALFSPRFSQNPLGIREPKTRRCCCERPEQGCICSAPREGGAASVPTSVSLPLSTCPIAQVVSTLEEFKQRRSLRPGGSPAPCVVITSSASLDSGFAHTLFMQVCGL